MFYINVFFIFSIIGHMIENIVYPYIDSGILFLPWTPIYGYGVIIILLINKYLIKLSIKKEYYPYILYISCGIIISLIEILAGYSIEFFLGRVFWNYSSQFGHIGKYTSLKMMLIWGISSLAIIYIVFPKIETLIKKVPKYITYTLIPLFIIDLFLTLKYLGDYLF